jgi:hypothetical protein
MVAVLTGEICGLLMGPAEGRDRRFAHAHIQQIAMYVCHVVLQLTLTEIGQCFHRDRTTVGHACARVEDRRDSAGYDALVAVIERIVEGMLSATNSEWQGEGR